MIYQGSLYIYSFIVYMGVITRDSFINPTTDRSYFRFSPEMNQKTIQVHSVINGDNRKRAQPDSNNGDNKRPKSGIVKIPDSVFSTTASFVTRPATAASKSSPDQKQQKSSSEQQLPKCICIAVIDNIATLLDIFSGYKAIPLGELNVKNISNSLFDYAFTDFVCSHCFEIRHFYPVKLLETANQLNFIFQALPAQHMEEFLSGVKSPSYYQYKFNTFIGCSDYKHLMASPNNRYVSNSFIRGALTKVKSETGVTSCYIIKQHPETGKLIRYGEDNRPIPQQQPQQQQKTTAPRGVLSIKT